MAINEFNNKRIELTSVDYRWFIKPLVYCSTPSENRRSFDQNRRNELSDKSNRRFNYLITFAMEDLPTVKNLSNDIFSYKPFSPRLAQVMWIIAVCQNNGTPVSQAAIAAILNTSRGNIANIIDQIKKRSSDYIKPVPCVKKLQITQSATSTKGEMVELQERKSYIIPPNKTVSKPETAQIVLEVQRLFNEGSFIVMTRLKRHLNKRFGFPPQYVKDRLTMAIDCNYLTVNAKNIVMPSNSNRIASEQRFLTKLVENPKPDFLATIVNLTEITK